MITEELFVSTLNAMQLQIYHDKQNHELLHEAFGVQKDYIHDSSVSLLANLQLLKFFFPRIEDFKRIESYCFEQNFGKPHSDSEHIEPRELYYKLTKS